MKLNIYLLLDSASLQFYSWYLCNNNNKKQNHICVQICDIYIYISETCTKIFIGALFLIDQNWENFWSLSTGTWINTFGIFLQINYWYMQQHWWNVKKMKTHYAEWKKHFTKEYILYDIRYMNSRTVKTSVWWD